MTAKRLFHSGDYEWIDVASSNLTETSQLRQDYALSDEILAYALDQNEKAHLEYEELTKTFLLIYNAPYQDKTDNHYETGPMTFIIKDRYIITIHSARTDYIINKMQAFLLNNPTVSQFEFLFSSLYLISNFYFPLIEEVNAESKVVNRKLREKATNKNILKLSDLEIGMVYLVMAAKQNSILLEQLKLLPFCRQMTASEKEQLDDALIEAKQLVEMTQLTSQILQQLSDTFNNLLNNSLNDTMKILAILSILLAIPTIVSGFFGMNMPLPLENNEAGWVVSLGIMLILCLVLAVLIKRKIK